MTRIARCCCGRCAIEVVGEPAINALCHCRNCKARTGSAFGWSSYFDDDRVVRVEGDFASYEVSANRQLRSFCRHCGTTLFWKVSWIAGRTGIAGGCFTDVPLAEPSTTVSNDWRCAWLELPRSWATSL